MLLAALAVVGAASIGKTACEAFTTPAGPLALRHLNVPLFLRLGSLALTLRRQGAERKKVRPPSWGELLASSEHLSELPEAIQLEHVCLRNMTFTTASKDVGGEVKGRDRRP